MDSPPPSKQPLHRNDPFTCEHCGAYNPASASVCRNHCTKCLYSKHVDLYAPGDRLSECGGLMEPVSITQKSGKEKQIVHICLKCGKKEANIVAPDDDIDIIIKVMHRQNIEFIHDQSADAPRKKPNRRF